MAHTHSHSHGRRGVGSVARADLGVRRLEAAAGFRAHSLALLSDAGHNFTDAFALVPLAACGVYWEARPGNHIKTFGYQRAGVLAAFVNALM